MTKIKKNILLFFLLLFSIFCGLIIGQTWDESFEIYKGKNTIEYLFSFGENNNYWEARERFSAIYWSILYLLTKQFPKEFLTESTHIINLFFSLTAVFGIARLSKELFNKKVAEITFLILFFYPIFFGHLSINTKDTILACCHVWISYLLFRYLKKQNKKVKKNRYIIYIGILAAIGTGIQIVFLGSLIPLFIFSIMEIIFFKKIITSNFDKKKLIIDIIKSFIIFYFLLLLFWIDVHQNIFYLPFKYIVSTFADSFWTGWPYNLVNGNYYLSKEIPKSYLVTNLIYKSPEYFLFTYIIFPFLFLFSKRFFYETFAFFNYKIIFLTVLLLYPILILYILPYPVYDGMRLFLWTLPYFCIVPALTFYYFISNFNSILNKILLVFLFILTTYFLSIFFLITPYQYTYLNAFNGTKETRYKKFENDYWGASIKELINISNFEKNKQIAFATCGINNLIAEKYFLKKENLNFVFVNPKDADYIIMTNRAVPNIKNENNSNSIINCFDNFDGKDIFFVERNGLTLSKIKKKF